MLDWAILAVQPVHIDFGSWCSISQDEVVQPTKQRGSCRGEWKTDTMSGADQVPFMRRASDDEPWIFWSDSQNVLFAAANMPQ